MVGSYRKREQLTIRMCEEAYSGPSVMSGHSHQGLNKLELPMFVAIRNVMLVTMASQNKVDPENKRSSVV